MKFFTKLSLLLSLSVSAFAQETICFKKNFTHIKTLDSVKLDGGVCSGIKSQTDMINQGWEIKNIEIKNDYFLFIFKKAHSNKQDIKSISSIKSEIIKEINDKKDKEIYNTKKLLDLKKHTIGKKFYLKKCASCHGSKGETPIPNSRDLNKMSLDQLKSAINAYRLGSYDLGNSIEMRPYSLGVTSSDIKNIYRYLKDVN